MQADPNIWARIAVYTPDPLQVVGLCKDMATAMDNPVIIGGWICMHKEHPLTAVMTFKRLRAGLADAVLLRMCKHVFARPSQQITDDVVCAVRLASSYANAGALRTLLSHAKEAGMDMAALFIEMPKCPKLRILLSRRPYDDCVCMAAACIDGSSAALNVLFEYGAPLPTKHNPLCAALTAAAVRTLLRAPGIDPNRGNPLHAAAHRGDMESVQMLLDAGADVNDLIKHGSHSVRASAFAAASGHLDTTFALLNHEAYPERHACRALVNAARNQHWHVVVALLARFGPDRLMSDSWDSFLMVLFAVNDDRPAMVRMLLSYTKTGDTSLMAFVQYRKSTSHTVAAAGANIDAVNANGDTALALACSRYDVQNVDMLLRCGASMSAGATKPIVAAVKNERLDNVRLLLDLKEIRAGKRFRWNLGQSTWAEQADLAMEAAIRCRKVHAVRMLLSACVDMNTPAVRVAIEEARQAGNAAILAALKIR